MIGGQECKKNEEIREERDGALDDAPVLCFSATVNSSSKSYLIYL
jgi:hypothetical protein